MSGKQSAPMDGAQRDIIAGKLTVKQASKKYGVLINSIYRRPWYKAWRAVKVAENAKP